MLIDTHAHLYWDSYQEDLDQVIQRASDQGVELIINIGVDLESSKKALRLASLSQGKIKFYSTIGIHPHDGGQEVSDESIRQLSIDLADLYNQHPDKIVAIGECGLDYHHLPVTPRENNVTLSETKGIYSSPTSQSDTKRKQLELYSAQVDLSKKLKLPLVIHCRDAWSDIFIPELQGTTGLFHNFSGTKEDANKALDLGYYLSFSCVVTYPKNEELRQILKETPLDKILTETDCPFLPPQAIRGQRNEPKYIKDVMKVISEIKGISVEDISSQIFENTRKLFGLHIYSLASS